MTFTSIVPACYTGRWPHIHVEFYPDEAGITEVALPQDVCDAVYATSGYETRCPPWRG